ncbi:MAG: hypothetical protein ACREQT_03090, partial [Candidatus Binataceae bacterium]
MSVRRHRWEAAMEERLEDQRRAMAAAVATMAEAGELSLAAADAVRALLRGIDPLGARAGSARRSPAR